jgi:hypothetical protein
MWCSGTLESCGYVIGMMEPKRFKLKRKLSKNNNIFLTIFLQGILKQYDLSNTMCITSIKPCQSALQNKHYPLNGKAPLQLQNDIFKKTTSL